MIGPCDFSGLVAEECESVIQRANGVRSVTFWMYQHFFFGSQRAPSALASSFSANPEGHSKCSAHGHPNCSTWPG